MTEEKLREEIVDRQIKLATIRPPDGDAAASVEHCSLQCDYWRLTFALATFESMSKDDKTRVAAKSMLKLASREGESWEGRRQQALKMRKADDLAECKRLMAKMLDEGEAFGELSD